MTSLFQLLMLKEGREILSFYNNIYNIDNRLLKQCGKHYKGEVALFALSPVYRGLGLGRNLFDSLTDYMKGQNIEDFEYVKVFL